MPPLPARRAPLVDDAEPSEMEQLNEGDALEALGVDLLVASSSIPDHMAEWEDEVDGDGSVKRVCRDCRAPVRPDPRPEEMCIFLHALRYEMQLGSFETAPPRWAQEEWRWGMVV